MLQAQHVPRTVAERLTVGTLPEGLPTRNGDLAPRVEREYDRMTGQFRKKLGMQRMSHVRGRQPAR